MNIAFDMTFAGTPSKERGIGFYCTQLLKSIQLLDQENRYFFFQAESFSTKEDLGRQLSYFIKKNQIDIYHILSPFDYDYHYHYHENFSIEKEWFGNAKLAVTLYDIIPFMFQNQYLPLPEIKKRYMKTLDFVKSCDIIFAISDTTKQDAIKNLKIDSDKIQVIYGGIHDHFTNRKQLVTTTRNNIEKPYILYVGGSDYRKNLERLIESFGKLNQKSPGKRYLIIAGPIPEEHKFFLKLNAQKSNVVDDVIFTGYVSDEELVKLYKGADLFAFPSLYEGFGLPILEAMACGVPVLTSSSSSLKEIAGSAAFLVNPESVSEIAEGMNYIVDNENVRIFFIKRGFERVEHFQWTKVAKKVLEGYQSLLE